MGQDVLTLEVCSAFPVYLQRFDDTRHFLIIPPVMIENIAKDPQTVFPRLPFWWSIYYANPMASRAHSKGEQLENMAMHCLRLRVSEELGQTNAKLKDSLPFLKNSRVADHVFSLTKGIKRFPKITSTPNRRSIEVLRKFFEFPDPKISDVNPQDLDLLVGLLETNAVYAPLGKSASADFLFLTDLSFFVEWQIKNGKQIVTSSMMADELQKLMYMCPNYTEGAFVMLALSTDSGKLPAGQNVLNDEGQVIAIQYTTGATFCNDKEVVTVPPNLDVIVVLEQGLLHFLTKSNVDLLRKDGLSLAEVSAAIESPSKKTA